MIPIGVCVSVWGGGRMHIHAYVCNFQGQVMAFPPLFWGAKLGSPGLCIEHFAHGTIS